MISQAKQRVVTCVIVISFLMSGCETMNDSIKTKAQAAGIGAAVCAALAIGLTDCDNCDKAKKRRKNALIAAALCAAVGYAYGSHVAKKKEEFASQEAYLDAVLAEANQVHEETRLKNNELAGEIATLDLKVQEANANQASSEQSQRDLKALRKELKGKHSAANTRLKILEREIAIQEAVVKAEKETAPADYQVRAVSTISALDYQKQSLQNYIAQLEAIDERVIR